MDRVMSRAALFVALVVAAAPGASASQDVYPALTRDTLVGTWEGVFGIGTIRESRFREPARSLILCLVG
jgi:hypothetical protein